MIVCDLTEGIHSGVRVIRSPSQRAVPARDSDGGTGLGQDGSGAAESLFGETGHFKLPGRLQQGRALSKHLTIVHW